MSLPSGARPVDRSRLAGPAAEVAPTLLNLLLVSTVDDVTVAGRIVEVEAYDEDDPASHTYRGRTPRNEVMFGPAGHLYVYLSYGIHQCANVVTGPEGRGEAVLIRALEPVVGVEEIRRRRAGTADRDLANGPGKLARALSIGPGHNGIDVCADASPVRIVDDGVGPPEQPLIGPRIGITKGVETPWRFRVPARER